ncbi:MAG: class II fructose-bisphosphate aldolase [Planctomycetota bacterium]|nr:class II fructose-bisphosphate aldolase [Planctomycetota bacterium]
MKFVPMKKLMAHAMKHGYAVPSFCAWNAESMATILAVCKRLRSPVILMAGPGEFPVLSPAANAAVARTMLARYRVKAALHLDHGDSPALVAECVKAGFTSVMLDYSTRSFEENTRALAKVCRLCGPKGITVEGEIGAVGKTDAATVEGSTGSRLTEPEEAAEYVKRTGVDCLAVSIGNAHGAYVKLPRFDFERLERIHEKVRIPLTLHGGTGTPEADLRRAIALGIAKVNVATALIAAYRESLLTQWNAGRNLWTPIAQGEAARAMAPVVEEWILRLNAQGKA